MERAARREATEEDIEIGPARGVIEYERTSAAMLSIEICDSPSGTRPPTA